MDIDGIAEKSGLSVGWLKKLDKLGYLIVDRPKNPIVDKIKNNLRKGNRLTAEQLLHLAKCPDDINLLHRWEYEVQGCLNTLGDPMQEKMPWMLAHNADLSASRDKEAAEKLARWFRDFIDGHPQFENGASCDYAHLVVRMLADVPEHQLEYIVKIARAAMWNCRRGQRMAGYYHTDAKGRLRFHRPAKAFDL